MYNKFDKVVPHSKYGKKIEGSIWEACKRKSQPYMYFVKSGTDIVDGILKEIAVCSDNNTGKFGGDYFLLTDLKPYKDPIKKVIKYKAKKKVAYLDINGDAANTVKGTEFVPDCHLYRYFTDIGILGNESLFETIYENVSINMVIGNPQRDIKIEKDKITISDKHTITRFELELLVNKMAGGNLEIPNFPQTVTVKSVQIGCKSDGTEVTKEDVFKVYNAQNELQ